MRIINILLLNVLPFLSFAQEGIESLTKEEAEKDQDYKINKGLDFGLSLGFNTVFDKLYEARISPIDNTVRINSAPAASFLISTAISVPLTSGRLGGRWYRKLDKNHNAYGPIYYVPFGWCFIATVNLVSFNNAASGTIFNQKIDGGIGIGYRVNENLLIAATLEMLSVRQPRDFLLNEYNGKVININSQPLTALNQDDNNYFRDRYMGAASLKFVYLITSNKVNK